jgi:hypothetical protein
MDLLRNCGLAVLAFVAQVPATQAPLFSPEERAAILEYWARPGLYEAVPAGDKKGTGRWVARYTSAGSTWIRELYRLRSDGKVVPTRQPEALTEQQKLWDAWVEARVQLDKWLAEQESAKRNAQEADAAAPEPATPMPPDPGPVPEDLAAALPLPPVFYEPAVPFSHKIAFPDAELSYEDHVTVPHKYAYFRFEKGVRSGGTKVADRGSEYIQQLFEQAAITEDLQRVFASVSLLEGGFDSVNTYDTGFVSVGFIQFASLTAGGGSLGQVLLRMKRDHGFRFYADFRRFGVDVTEQGLLVVVDPVTGMELVGPDANHRVIYDKRLIAVFQRAGQVSDAFNVCQLQVARDLYYPAEDDVTVEFGGKKLTCKVKDIFRSEAGMATLMDRKVNTGKLEPLEDYLYDLVSQTGITDLKEAAKYEWALAKVMAYRVDYLASATLSQPVRLDMALSRGNSPRDRRGGGG